MVYATCIVQDEATGATYMDMVTALVGRVALRKPCMVANMQGPNVETSLTSLRAQREMTIWEQSNYGSSCLHH